MERYFFDITRDGQRSEDAEGHEFSGMQAAKAEAALTLRTLLMEDRSIEGETTLLVEIRSAAGSQIFRTMARITSMGG